MGGAYAQPIDIISADERLVYTLEQVEAEKGYIIEEGTTRYYIWVTDYSRYPLTLNGIYADDDRDCSTVTIHVEGEGHEIHYYTINGARKTLSRDLKISYYNLEWDDSTHWQQNLVTELQENFKPTIVMPAPLAYRMASSRKS